MPRAVRYRVLRKIAHGGMAEIFLALQTGAEGFQKPVVLKRILPAFAADPHFVRMLVDEAHIASSLSHSHLVQVLDLGKAGGQYFLVLEFVDGWSLEQVRRRAQKARIKFPLPLALHVVAALCRGLSYVHRRERDGRSLGIVHRDVSPQNVLLGREGEVKLADFGIAKAVGRREKSATGIIKGKFAYMSPEQSIGAALDARSDLFSVGTLLYILTTGRKPFDAPNDVEVLMQVRRARYEKPSALVKDFNPEVERFIARALRADRARRWQTAEQMADRLDAILVKLGQASGPAALKRWLEALSARDGVVPPGDVRAAEAEVSVGTIELETDDLELHDTASGELAAAPRRTAVAGEAAAGSGVSYLSLSVSPLAPSVNPIPLSVEPRAQIPGQTQDRDHDRGYDEHEAPTRPAPLLTLLGEPPTPAPTSEADPELDDDDVPIHEEAPISAVARAAPARTAAARPDQGDGDGGDEEDDDRDDDEVIATRVDTPGVDSTSAGNLADAAIADVVVRQPPLPLPVAAPSLAAPRAPNRRRSWVIVRRMFFLALFVAVLGGAGYVARPHVPSPALRPWFFARVVRPVDVWLRRLPLRFAPGARSPAPPLPPAPASFGAH